MNTLLLPLLFLALPRDGPLAAPAPKADLGDVKSGPALKCEFELKHSEKQGAIAITGVASSCGCSKLNVDRKILEPGETAKLSVAINTLTQPEGPATWKCTVKYTHASDPTIREIELTLKAKIVREITVEPPMLALSTGGDTARTHGITVTDRRATGGMTIAKATCTNAKITLDIKPAKPAGTGTAQEIAVTIPGDLPTGAHDDIITLTTTDAACPEVKIPLKIAKRAAGDVSVSPESPTVRFTKGQAEASVLVQLRAGGKAISISKVECKQDGVTVKFSEGNGPAATARIVVNSAKASTVGQTDVTIHLTEPAGAVVVIPVSWYVP